MKIFKIYLILIYTYNPNLMKYFLIVLEEK